jgi:Flp pilus assembly protein TadD
MRLNSNYPMVHNNLGSLLIDLKRYAEAEAECREAIRLSPDFAIAHNGLARALESQRKYAGRG